MAWRGIGEGIKSIPRYVGDWLIQPEAWQVRHFAASPFGASLMTWFWTWQARFWEHWDTVAEMASLGAISYGVIAVLMEGGFRLFYTLSLIGKDRQRRQRELTEIRAKGIAEGQAEGRAEGRAEGAAAERKRWQAWNAAREQALAEGREFNEPPPGN